MPLYNFCCAEGHVTESRQAMAVESIACACGLEGRRQSVYRFNLGGDLPTRFRLTEYQEAAQESNYYHEKMENVVGDKIPRRDLVGAAKQKARAMGAKVK